MRNFCAKCGSPIDDDGKCPNCEKKQSKKELKAEKKSAKNQEKKDKKAQKKAQLTKKQKVKRLFLKFFAVLLALIIAVSSCLCALVYFDVLDIPFVSSALVSMGIKPDEEEKEENSNGDNNANSDSQATDVDKPLVLYNFKGNYHEILCGEKQEVLFTVEPSENISDNQIVLETVTGEDIGYLNDDGQNGDIIAKDGIYSKSVVLSSDSRESVTYRAAYLKTVSHEFEIVFYTEITDEEYSKFDDLYSQILGCSSLEEVETVLIESDCIEDYRFQNDGVTFVTTFGMTGIYEWNRDSDLKGSGNYAVDNSHIDYSRASENARSANLVPSQAVTNSDIAVLRPFRNSGFRYDDFLQAGEILADVTGGEANRIDDSNVTLETMKSLDNYKITLIDSHGTLTDSNDPYILTGEKFFEQQAWSSADYQARRVVFCNGENGGYLAAVGAKFFDRYYDDGDLNDSMFFLGTCYSLINDSIANVLMKKGAKVVFGYNESVSTDYCNKTLFETVINSMLLSLFNTNDAYNEATRIYGVTDPHSEKACAFLMRGDTNYKLVMDQVFGGSSERDIVLVLDVSGSMNGTPLDETKEASQKFINTVLRQDASIGIVAYDNQANMVSNFNMNESYLTNVVSELNAGGGTNIEAGLSTANDMLKSSKAKKKIIVLMSDGEPNDGKIGDELIEYANSIKDEGIYIYTLGFFESLGGGKSSAQLLMEGIASEGYHYEVDDADKLVFFFEDIADQLNGQQYIYIRIACPTDVIVEYDGEILCSADDDFNGRTSFGTLTLEDIEDSDEKIKTLRLKDGVDYDVKIEGTGRGKMDYTIGYMDESGEYNDFRKFRNIPITKKTVIDTTTKLSNKTVLNVDEDGDGKYDSKYSAEANGIGELVDYTYVYYIIIGSVAAIVMLTVTVIIIKKIKNKKRKVI